MMKNKQLPQDAIEEILSRLPVKPLARLKCVSKTWYTLISSRNFVKKHLARTLSDPCDNSFRILMYWPYCTLDYESPSSLEDSVGTDAEEDFEDPLGPEGPYIDRHVIGSCHGLIALMYDSNRIIVWNPSIRVVRELPPPPPNPNATAFYGFGHDDSTDYYKVIKVVRSKSTNETTAYVFCTNGDSWRTIEGPHKGIIVHEHESCYFHGLMGTFLHGSVHWLADKVSSGAGKHSVILHFNLSTESFSEQTPPRIIDQTRFLEYLWVLNDRLALLSTSSRLDVDVWVMKEYGISASWSKLFSIDEDELINLEYGEYLAPLCSTRNGDVIIDLDGKGMVRYNIQEKTFQYLKGLEEMHQCNLYVQSLVSPCANYSGQ